MRVTDVAMSADKSVGLDTSNMDAVRRFVLGGTVAGLLEAAADVRASDLYARDVDGQTFTIGDLQAQVARASVRLRELGVSRRSRVAVALPNSMAHVALIFALLEIGALWVPTNVKLRGDALKHVLLDCGASHFVGLVHGQTLMALKEVCGCSPTVPLECGSGFDGVVSCKLVGGAPEPPSSTEQTAGIIYTSGTTGPAKGVEVTHSMLRASALGAQEVTRPRVGDVFYIWEPLCHIGGAQMLLMPLFTKVSLALAPGFRASQFWQDVARAGATHVHYLGGILQMLLARESQACEREHQVRVAWGAGATPSAWTSAQNRFGVSLHECYGMTETSSFVTVNRDEPDSGVGSVLPWFEMRLGELEGLVEGEIQVRGRLDGIVTPGYLGNPEASAAARREDGFWGTGDLGALGVGRTLHFKGRTTDSFRVRGENVSAWEVENVVNQHPGIERSAVIGVPSPLGEQELLLHVAPLSSVDLRPDEVHQWMAERLARFQVPRYVRIANSLPITPSERVAKRQLSDRLEDAYDAHAAQNGRSVG